MTAYHHGMINWWHTFLKGFSPFNCTSYLKFVSSLCSTCINQCYIVLTVISALAAPIMIEMAYMTLCNLLGRRTIPRPDNIQSTAPAEK
jgi:hypothetical protein